MNCLEFRRQLLSDPHARSAAAAEHRLSCPSCAEFAAKLYPFEHTLKQAAHIDPPEGLASRILLRQRLSVRRHSFWRLGIWSTAATVVLTLSLLLRSYLATPLGMAESVLAHVQDELHHMYEKNNVSLSRVNDQLNSFGAQLNEVVATVNFASPCAMRKAKGYHLVFAGQSGPVTVLLMPGDPVEQRLDLANQRFKGVVVPIRNGSMAIVAEDPLDVNHFETRLRTALQFHS